MIVGLSGSSTLGMTYLQLVEELWSMCRKNGLRKAGGGTCAQRLDVRWL